MTITLEELQAEAAAHGVEICDDTGCPVQEPHYHPASHRNPTETRKSAWLSACTAPRERGAGVAITATGMLTYR